MDKTGPTPPARPTRPSRANKMAMDGTAATRSREQVAESPPPPLPPKLFKKKLCPQANGDGDTSATFARNTLRSASFGLRSQRSSSAGHLVTASVDNGRRHEADAEKMVYLDPLKRTKTSDSQIKAIQKRALLEFYLKQSKKTTVCPSVPHHNNNNTLTQSVPASRVSSTGLSSSSSARDKDYRRFSVTASAPDFSHTSSVKSTSSWFESSRKSSWHGSDLGSPPPPLASSSLASTSDTSLTSKKETGQHHGNPSASLSASIGYSKQVNKAASRCNTSSQRMKLLVSDNPSATFVQLTSPRHGGTDPLPPAPPPRPQMLQERYYGDEDGQELPLPPLRSSSITVHDVQDVPMSVPSESVSPADLKVSCDSMFKVSSSSKIDGWLERHGVRHAVTLSMDSSDTDQEQQSVSSCSVVGRSLDSLASLASTATSSNSSSAYFSSSSCSTRRRSSPLRAEMMSTTAAAISCMNNNNHEANGNYYTASSSSPCSPSSMIHGAPSGIVRETLITMVDSNLNELDLTSAKSPSGSASVGTIWPKHGLREVASPLAGYQIAVSTPVNNGFSEFARPPPPLVPPRPPSSLLVRYADSDENTKPKVNHCDTLSPCIEVLTVSERELLDRKLNSLKEEEASVVRDMAANNANGSQLMAQFRSAGFSGHETEKMTIHCDEMDKVTKLLISLKNRLKRIENDLQAKSEKQLKYNHRTALFLESAPYIKLPDNLSDQPEIQSLIAKRSKLLQQLEEAVSLKQAIDRRSETIADKIVCKYFDSNSNEVLAFLNYARLKVDLSAEKIGIAERRLQVEQEIKRNNIIVDSVSSLSFRHSLNNNNLHDDLSPRRGDTAISNVS
ncbi:Protein Shroom2 [Halotydeus destructor]|nr:Protein Shroom2 [Halotydeus destructor]